MKHILGDRLEQRPAARERRGLAARHDRHIRRPPADRGIEKSDAALAARRGETADRFRRVRRQIDIGATVGEAGKQPGFRIERRGLDLVRARQRGEDNLARFGQRASSGRGGAPRRGGRLAPES
jgi:hypothetical protein